MTIRGETSCDDRAAQDVRAVVFYRLPDAAEARADTTGAELPGWKRVRAARPGFIGHSQPQLPADFGYCDVRDPAVREAHAALAGEYGVSAFCYVFRAAADASVLDPTLAAILSSGKPDFPFCVCWETTASNAGGGFDIEDNQHERRFSREECKELVRGLLAVFADRRYLRIDDRPLFLISSPGPIPEIKAVAALWREECARAGAGDPYLACCGSAYGAGPDPLGFDAIVDFPPLGGFPRGRNEELVRIRADFEGDARCYRSYVGQLLASPRPRHRAFCTVMPGWDGTARGGRRYRVFVNANPETFGYWTEHAIELTRLRFGGEQRLLFVRAWNEWDGACHLEPDTRVGRRNLEALRSALQGPMSPEPLRPAWSTVGAWAAPGGGIEAVRIERSSVEIDESAAKPLVSIVMPAYNHARFVVEALDSIVAQSHRNLEIIVVDDGSRDETGAMLDDYAARCTSHPLTVVHQTNAGAHEAINHGLALARGDVIALMNSDDRYAPSRVERLLEKMRGSDAALAFSNTKFIDDEGHEVIAADPNVTQFRRAVAEALKAPDLLYVLVYYNIAISTGNFILKRDLLERTGGFCAMRVCHDWDFLLAASIETPLAFVDEPLYEYRLHGTNTFSASRIRAAFELEQTLSRFLARLGEHRIGRDPAALERFRSYLREIGFGGYL